MKIILFVSLLLWLLPLYSQNLYNDSLNNLLLEKINYHRKITGAKPLLWSDDLAKRADGIGFAFHSVPSKDTSKVPKMLRYTSTNFPNPDDIVNYWLKEQRYYHGEAVTKKNLLIFGHYTSLIWKQTKYIGCSVKQTKGGTYFVICLLFPPGNSIGQKP